MTDSLWKVANKVGRPPAFETSEQLWSACTEYFEWVEAHPLQESKVMVVDKELEQVSLPKMRAMTVTGMCVHIGITRETWNQYRSKEGFEDVCAKVDAIIWAQKFEGASAGLLNHAIIIRELGLAEKTELSGKDGGPIQTQEVNAREKLADRIVSLAARKRENQVPGEFK